MTTNRASWALASALAWQIVGIVLFLVAVRPLLRAQRAILQRQQRALDAHKDMGVRAVIL